ncbi:MAG: PKD domain-containing protein [Gammaproteobacteria bacterium]
MAGLNPGDQIQVLEVDGCVDVGGLCLTWVNGTSLSLSQYFLCCPFGSLLGVWSRDAGGVDHDVFIDDVINGSTDGLGFGSVFTAPEGPGPHYLFLGVNDSWFDDNSGGWILTLRVVRFNPPAPVNLAPIANAGQDQTATAGDLVTLDGSGSSDPDNGPSPLTFSWTQTAGPAVTLIGATTATPTFTPTVVESYTFSLTVNDGRDNSPADDVTIIATPAAEFTINVTSFIPANYVQAYLRGLPPHPQAFCGPRRSRKELFFKGDDRMFSATSDSFRTRQSVKIITEQSSDPNGLVEGTKQNLTGETRSYAENALADQRIDADDDDGIPNDCDLFHQTDKAKNTQMKIRVRRIGPNTVRAHLFGGAGNPLLAFSPPINWDFTIDINTAGPKPSWTLSGAHDGFPAFEIYINNHPIYPNGGYDPGPRPYTTAQIIKLAGRLDVPVEATGELP